MQPSLFNKAMLCAFGKVGKPRMVLKDKQLMAIQHVYMARMCLYLYGYRQIWQMYEFLPFVFMPRVHFGKAEVAYRQATFLHGVATHCNHIFYWIRIVLRVIICKFSLRILMNYTQNSSHMHEQWIPGAPLHKRPSYCLLWAWAPYCNKSYVVALYPCGLGSRLTMWGHWDCTELTLTQTTGSLLLVGGQTNFSWSSPLPIVIVL